MGTIIVLGVVVLIAGGAIHSLIKGRKSKCAGSCGSCKGCH